ncbi:hypothetical protein ACFWB1_38335, partial [Streptomyces goshikiensis]|uniref:hypothetical protein n=1 Tax=Streptomyces goshikiensis TaxID=1942 RepID=UPI0036B9F109
GRYLAAVGEGLSAASALIIWPPAGSTQRPLTILGTDGWTEVHFVLFQGGWADLDALTNNEVTTECPQITTPEEFGNLLDSSVTRFLGTGRRPAI